MEYEAWPPSKVESIKSMKDVLTFNNALRNYYGAISQQELIYAMHKHIIKLQNQVRDPVYIKVKEL